MTASFDDFDRGDMDFELSEAFTKPTETPDVTRRVMGRLGYMRVVDSVLRKRRRQLWLWRGGCTLAMVMAAGVGWRVYQTSSAVRAPAEITVPGAIMHDAQQSRMQFQNLIQSIRQQSQPMQRPAEDSVQPSQEESWPTDDVNRSAGAPGQWV